MAFSAEWRPGEKGPQAGEPERPGLVPTADPLAGTLTPSGVPQEHPETPLGHSTLTKTLPHLPVPLTHARRCDPSGTLWQLAPVLPSLPTSPPLAGLLPGAQPPLGPPHTPPALCPARASRLELLLVPSPAAPPPCALPCTPEGTPGGDVAPWAGRRQPQGHRPASGSSACPRPRPACQTRPGPVPQPCSGQRSAPRVGGLVTLACRRPRRRLAPSRVGRSARASAFPAAPPPHSPGAWGRAWHTGRAQYYVSTIVSLRKRNYFFSQTRNVSSISH